jgi:hypothetical protein
MLMLFKNNYNWMQSIGKGFPATKARKGESTKVSKWRRTTENIRKGLLGNWEAFTKIISSAQRRLRKIKKSNERYDTKKKNVVLFVKREIVVGSGQSFDKIVHPFSFFIFGGLIRLNQSWMEDTRPIWMVTLRLTATRFCRVQLSLPRKSGVIQAIL